MPDQEPAAPTPETVPDPTTGTPPATPGPVAATPQAQAPTVDWEARYKALQPEVTRNQQARAAAERELNEFKAAATETGDDEAPSAARPARRTSESDREWQKRALAAEWQIASSVYGEEVIAAYNTAQDLLSRATTPADFVTAFEAFHQARSKAATPQAPAPAAPAAAAPIVDSNQSDGPLLTEVDQKLREAAEKKDLRGWLNARLAKG